MKLVTEPGLMRSAHQAYLVSGCVTGEKALKYRFPVRESRQAMQGRTKEDERWASRGLVAMLVRDLKNYSAAAEIVSGADDVLAMCSRLLADNIARIQETPERKLPSIKDGKMKCWRACRPGAMKKALQDPTRAKLLAEVMQADDKWLPNTL
jgi:hypothetical protein